MGGGGSRNYIKGCVRDGRGSAEGVGNKVGVNTGFAAHSYHRFHFSSISWSFVPLIHVIVILQEISFWKLTART